MIDSKGFNPSIHTKIKGGFVLTSSLEQQAKQKRISREVFRNKFTFAEKVAIVSSPRAEIKVILSDLQNKTSPLNLKGENVSLAMDILIAENIINAERKAELLAYENI